MKLMNESTKKKLNIALNILYSIVIAVLCATQKLELSYLYSTILTLLNTILHIIVKKYPESLEDLQILLSKTFDLDGNTVDTICETITNKGNNDDTVSVASFQTVKNSCLKKNTKTGEIIGVMNNEPV